MLKELLTLTDDGSLSLREPALGELYHNKAGAYKEALINYAEPALALFDRSCDLTVLDSCFGLGYNSLVLAQELAKEKRRAQVLAVELDSNVLDLLPLILAQPVFSDSKLTGREAIEDAYRIISSNERRLSFGNSKYEIRQTDLRDFLRTFVAPATIDLVFHDAFSPRKVPELWTIDLFDKYKELLKANGAILTYSSSAAVRGALQDLGFTVLRSAALGGKSGGTVAIKGELASKARVCNLFRPIEGEELARLQTSSRVAYRDENLRQSRETIQSNRLLEQKEYLQRR